MEKRKHKSWVREDSKGWGRQWAWGTILQGVRVGLLEESFEQRLEG